ncbi:MAG: VWA domain-containing protein [Crocinitomicaceae bacterium]|nr:VWA domain-containing protein [Crocinitomicaceae bacterium]
MKKEEYNGQFDEFDVPTNMWDKIEPELDTNTKKKNFIWWRIAAVGIILIGIGVFFAYQPLDQSTKVNIARVNIPDLDSTTNANRKQMLADKKMEYSYNRIQPLMMQQQENADMLVVSGGDFNLNVGMAAYDISGNSSYTMTFSDGCATTSYITDLFQGETKTPLTEMELSYSRLRSHSSRYGRLNEERLNHQYDNLGCIGRDLELDEYTNSSSYDEIVENEFLKVRKKPLSTFSIDVDGASYSDVRGMINRVELPEPNMVRLEEFVNYFPYDYAEPSGRHPFSIHTELSACPWNEGHQLLKIGIKGKSIEAQELPRNNLVFLLDVSGSMTGPEKLGLLKNGFQLLVNEMREQDRVSIVVYAGAAGLVLPATSGAHKDRIMDALNELEAGGSTAGGEGIELAYSIAQENFDPNGNNRVILATDGDFNVGVSQDDALIELIEEKRKSGVFLTVLGVGSDNFQASKMEKIANKGNGNFSFIDNIMEAKKVLVTEMGATLQTIAKDVKIQIEFNPALVASYRLLGYENRLLNNEDFDNDAIDAGELGAGHTVTAIYEIVTREYSGSLPTLRESNSSNEQEYVATGDFNNELALIKFRYKEPDGTKSKLIKKVIAPRVSTPSEDFLFIQSIVEFGLILRDSKYAGTANFNRVLKNAEIGLGRDQFGYRGEFIDIVKKASRLR